MRKKLMKKTRSGPKQGPPSQLRPFPRSLDCAKADPLTRASGTRRSPLGWSSPYGGRIACFGIIPVDNSPAMALFFAWDILLRQDLLFRMGCSIDDATR